MSSTDAVQDDRILSLQSKTAENSVRIDQVSSQLADLTVAFREGVGFMKGIGALGVAIAIMQLASMFMGRKGRGATS